MCCTCACNRGICFHSLGGSAGQCFLGRRRRWRGQRWWAARWRRRQGLRRGMRAGNGARHEGVRRKHSKACRLWQEQGLGPVCAHGRSGHHTMQWCARGGCGVASCAWHVRSTVHDGGVWRACTRGGARGGQSREVREASVSHGGDSTFYLFSRTPTKTRSRPN